MATGAADRVRKVLTSRKVAAWLLAALAAWSAVGTSFREWAFSSPLFLGATTWLLLGTTLCAWERTRHSAREWKRRGVVTDALAERLRARPQATVRVGDGPAALGVAVTALRRMRLGVRSGPSLAEGAAGAWGLFGSPLFHWSLALLIAVVGLGQLTRSEGLMGVPVGESRPEEASSYGHLETGPLHLGHTGLEVAVTDLALEFPVDGIDRGPAPMVELRDEGGTVASQRVYPNNPLRYGRLLVHADDHGLAPVVSLLDSEGAEMARETFLSDFDETQPGGLAPVEFGLGEAPGQPDRYTVRLVLFLPEGDEEEGRIELEVARAGSLLVARDVGTGERVELPTGEALVVESVGLYTRLSVADDWSVPYIYALLALASLGMSVAVFSPYRKVWVMLVEDEEGPGLNVRAKHWRGRPTFAEDVERAVRSAVAADGLAYEEDGDDD
jgi:cytochrome c biogenesis protein ResB